MTAKPLVKAYSMTRPEARILLLDTRKDSDNQSVDYSVCMFCKKAVGVYVGGLAGAAHLDCLNAEVDRIVGAETKAADSVNRPQGNDIEAIDVIEAFNLGFCLGNTVKYVLRAGKKGERLEDLRKAAWYLEREIARESGSKGGAA